MFRVIGDISSADVSQMALCGPVNLLGDLPLLLPAEQRAVGGVGRRVSGLGRRSVSPGESVGTRQRGGWCDVLTPCDAAGLSGRSGRRGRPPTVSLSRPARQPPTDNRQTTDTRPVRSS